ncbi:MAG: M23 family metallopeptidase [Deltaproteobacteria bacterium]|nr:M23 family metallopeptidase [Deltaproteobacteria bacterium]
MTDRRFDYIRAKAYIRSGELSDLVADRGFLCSRLKTRVWMLIPSLLLCLMLSIVTGRMLARDPMHAEMLLPGTLEKIVADCAVLTSAVPADGSAGMLSGAPYAGQGGMARLAAQEQCDPKVLTRDIVVKRGDTLLDLLVREGLARDEAHGVIGALKQVFNPRRLSKDQCLTITYESPQEASPAFKSLNIKLDPVREVTVDRCGSDGFTANEIVRECESRTMCAEFQIDSSLYESAAANGVPFEMLLPVVNAYAYDVDFQRDIQPGDTFEIMYDMKVDGDGKAFSKGTVSYAALTTGGRRLALYQYLDKSGDSDYFDAQGRSLKKNLMITPIEGARISSGFGRRRHPILGYSRMHKGLDFAASSGTPIMASGDGVVESAGYKSDYGNVVRLRHSGSYNTLYAHMRRFAQGIRPGVRVRQGQVIGYVGSTGLSTGPHLHYEVLHHGRNLNPASIKSQPNRILQGPELERFMTAKSALEVQFASLKKPAVFAQLPKPEA